MNAGHGGTWYMSVIPTTQESEAKGLGVQGQPWLNQTPCQNKQYGREETEPLNLCLKKT